MSVGNVERIPGQTARLTVQLRDMVAWIWPKRLAARARLAAIATGAIGAGRDADLLRPAIVAVSWRDRPTGSKVPEWTTQSCYVSSIFPILTTGP